MVSGMDKRGIHNLPRIKNFRNYNSSIGLLGRELDSIRIKSSI